MEEDIKIEISDRYSATGTPRPDPQTMCPGPCEGMGCVPVRADNADEAYRALWVAAEEKLPADDGWHFATCQTCHGTRLRAPVKAL